MQFREPLSLEAVGELEVQFQRLINSSEDFSTDIYPCRLCKFWTGLGDPSWARMSEARTSAAESRSLFLSLVKLIISVLGSDI